MPLGEEDRKRIGASIKAAEARSSGEIVCVLARSSGDYSAVPLAFAAIVALALPWPLIGLTQYPIQRIYVLQLLLFCALALLLSLPSLRLALVPRALQRAQAHRAAAEQFLIRGMARTGGRTGVLIFVSLAERYARVIADDGIAAKVGQAEWQGIVDGLVAQMRNGRVADGFVAAVEASGAVLAAHFPPRGPGVDELPDRIYVI